MQDFGAAAEQNKPEKKKRSWLPWLLVIILLAVLGAGYWTLTKNKNAEQTTKEPTAKRGEWQAVFLTNGQVYFGKIGREKADSLELTNVYYLKVQQAIQPPTEENKKPEAQSQLSLSKLGRFELHCPEDAMTINRQQVLFWEDLKPESKVVQAITEYLKTDDAKKKCYEKQA